MHYLLKSMMGIVFFNSFLTAQNPDFNKEIKKETQNFYSSIDTGNDSLRLASLAKLVKHSFKAKEDKNFLLYLSDYTRTSKLKKNTAHLAKSYEYHGAYFRNKEVIDSAYWYYLKSYQLYKSTADSLKAGKALINLAILQKKATDYKGSLNSINLSLKYLTASRSDKRLADALNTKGLVYGRMEEYDSAIYFLKSALTTRQKLGDELLIIHSLNNIGLQYQRKDLLNKALQTFKKTLYYEGAIKRKPLVYATVLDNIAYTNFKRKNFENVERDLLRSKEIRDSLKDSRGQIISALHLLDYYRFTGDNQKMLYYAKESSSIADSIGYFDDYLQGIALIGSIEDKSSLFGDYTSLQDSLNKENNQLKKRMKNMSSNLINTPKRKKIAIWILAFFGLLLIGFFLFLVINKRNKLEQNIPIDKSSTSESKADKLFLERLSPEFFEHLKSKYELKENNLKYLKYRNLRYTESQIAEKLFISENGISYHRKEILKKFIKVHGEPEKRKGFIDEVFRNELENYYNTTPKG